MRNIWFACGIVAGCAPAVDSRSPATPPPIVKLDADGESPSFHDFGTVLTSGQPLVHSFRLMNRSDRPRKVLGARAMTPCCSSMAPLPDAVPANGSIEVTVGLQTRDEQGPKSAEFLVAWEGQPTAHFAVQAFLVSEHEVQLEDGSDRRLLAGRVGKQRFRVTSRREGDADQAGVVRVVVDQPLRARLLEVDPAPRIEAGRIQVWEQRVEVDLPAGESAGPRTATLRLIGEDQWERTHRIQWEVVPPVRVTPAVLVRSQSEETAQSTIVARAEDGRAFRILGIEPDSYADRTTEFPTGPSLLHRLELNLPPTAEADGGAETVTLRTDHPEMARATFRIVRFARKESEGASP